MAGILGIEYVLPEEIVSNKDLAKLFNSWSAEKIFQKTGIKERHVVAEGETAVDLGVRAAEKLFQSGIIKKDEIDFVLLNTQSPDYILPSSSCIIQNRLGLKKNVGAFDYNLGCSGFVYGLAIAKGLVDGGIANKVLLITAETYTKHINSMDRSTRTIFGDGAAATLIGRGGMEIGNFDLGTDGSGSEMLIIPAGGMRKPRTEDTSIVHNIENNFRSEEDLFMDGTGVFDFTIREVPRSVDRVLQNENVSKDNVDLFVFHQANQFILDFLRRKMKIAEDKFYINFADIGNTVSASIPIALKRAIDEKKITANQTVLMAGFGVGLSWASTVIRTGNYLIGGK